MINAAWCLLAVLLVRVAGAAAAPSHCLDIGQIAHPGLLEGGAVEFFDMQGEPAVAKAEVNSPACRKARAVLSENDLHRLQMATGESRSVLAILRRLQQKDGTNKYCLAALFKIRELSQVHWAMKNELCPGLPADLLKATASAGPLTQPIYIGPIGARILRDLSTENAP